MREILFRGKIQQPCGEWIYGSLLTDYPLCKNEVDETVKFHYIINGKAKELKKVRVIPETVGQYTGLTDKNGKKIFEGDIVKHFDNSNENYDIGEIYYDTKLLMWRRTTQGSFHKALINSYKLGSDCIYEVIGNTHDNPELLKGGADE